MLYLSVLHHVNRVKNENGTKYVQDLIRASLDKVPFIIFELAHKQENVTFPWRRYLPKDILDYFNHLPENGFELHYVQDFPTHLSEVPRPMYVLERKYIPVRD